MTGISGGIGRPRQQRPSGGALSSTAHDQPRRTSGTGVRVSAVVAAALLAAVAVFQAALVLGAPWGEATQGGRASTMDGVLTSGPRALAAVSACLLLFSAWIVLARAGVVANGPLGDRFVRVAAWIVAALLAVNTIANLAGRHPFERWVMGTVSLGAMLLAAVVARSKHS